MKVVKSLPASYTPLTPMNMVQGDSRPFPPSAITVDVIGRCWVDPFAEPAPKVSVNGSKPMYQNPKNLVFLERLERGFKLDLTGYEGPQFKQQAKPEPNHGIDWMEVVEFLVPEDSGP